MKVKTIVIGIGQRGGDFFLTSLVALSSTLDICVFSKEA